MNSSGLLLQFIFVFKGFIKQSTALAMSGSLGFLMFFSFSSKSKLARNMPSINMPLIRINLRIRCV